MVRNIITLQSTFTFMLPNLVLQPIVFQNDVMLTQ